MDIENLIKLGFNKNEAKVYLAIIKFRKADARTIIKETKFHKNIVYDNLEKLIDKGLISFIIEENKKVFEISASYSLIDYFEKKEKEIQEKKKSAEVLSEEIDKLTKELPQKQEATVYRGVNALRAFYKQTLEKGDYVVFGSPKESVDIMGEGYWENYNLKRSKNKTNVKMIFNHSLRYHGKLLVNQFTKIRYFEKDFEPLTETLIQGDEVAITVWTKEPMLFLIKDKQVADSYQKFFDKMWSEAKA
ncbi:MAG: helix-turn-helix domain-containing protein [Candidatus Nanoarchaeia archaeon]